MRILVISRSVFSNSPQSIRFRNLIESWRANHSIKLLTFKDNINVNSDFYRQNEIFVVKKNFFTSKIAKSLFAPRIQNRTESNRAIGLLKKVNYRKFFFPDTYIFTILAIKKKLLEILKSSHFDVIIISGFPFSFQIFGKHIRKSGLFEGLVVYDTGDPFYGNSSVSTQGLMHKLFSFKYENKHLSYFDFIVVPTERLKNHYERSFPKLKNKILIVAQGVQMSESQTSQSIPLQLEKVVKLVYIGSFYKGIREPYKLFEALDGDSRFLLNIFGRINPEFYIEQNNIKYNGEIEYSIVNEQYQKSNIVVFIDNFEGFQIPGKLFEVLVQKKPILFISGDLETPSKTYVSNISFVFVVENNKKSILKGVERILESYDNIDCSFDSSELSWSYLAKEYLESIANEI
ncbi:MAG: hypothetical protein M0Q90_13765 [Bacteroidales bacterium]|nr:hypothetical protein [Bacteroidales bacterium]